MKLMKRFPLGETPMIAIRCRFDGEEREIYSKLEYYNPSGSIKDRVAAVILERAAARGEFRPGQPIVEMTSGNTGIAFAALGALLGCEVHIFMPDWASEERKRIMELYGARLHLISREEGGFERALAAAREAAGAMGAFEPRQFENGDNVLAHMEGTAPEILSRLPDVTDFVSGVGSGGTIMGVARGLRAARPRVRIAAVEPETMSLLSGGTVRGEHRIEGIGDSFIPAIVDQSLIDRVHTVDDEDAIAMAAKLARELGLGVGISSGANFLGALLQGGKDSRVATVFADDNKKYLSTDLTRPLKLRDEMISARTELLDIRVL